MIWSLPDTYHSAGHGRGTATFKFYEGRDILEHAAHMRNVVPAGWRSYVIVYIGNGASAYTAAQNLACRTLT
jgi:hypothetical protein